jgi:hypothetical protein
VGERRWLLLEAWFGLFSTPVEVLRELGQTTLVKTQRRACLPSAGWCDAGTNVRVPSSSLSEKRPEGAARG